MTRRRKRPRERWIGLIPSCFQEHLDHSPAKHGPRIAPRPFQPNEHLAKGGKLSNAVPRRKPGRQAQLHHSATSCKQRHAFPRNLAGRHSCITLPCLASRGPMPMRMTVACKSPGPPLSAPGRYLLYDIPSRHAFHLIIFMTNTHYSPYGIPRRHVRSATPLLSKLPWMVPWEKKMDTYLKESPA